MFKSKILKGFVNDIIHEHSWEIQLVFMKHFNECLCLDFPSLKNNNKRISLAAQDDIRHQYQELCSFSDEGVKDEENYFRFCQLLSCICI